MKVVEFNRKLIKKGPNVQLKIDHVLSPTCLVIRQEAQGDHNGHDWQGQKAEVARQFVAERDREEDGDIPKYDQEMGESRVSNGVTFRHFGSFDLFF